MGNPMLDQLNKLPSNNQNNNLISMLQNASNPQQFIQNAIAQNPQVNMLIQQYGGGDPKAAFYEYARRNGKDPNLVLNMLRRYI